MGLILRNWRSALRLSSIITGFLNSDSVIEPPTKPKMPTWAMEGITRNWQTTPTSSSSDPPSYKSESPTHESSSGLFSLLQNIGSGVKNLHFNPETQTQERWRLIVLREYMTNWTVCGCGGYSNTYQHFPHTRKPMELGSESARR